MLWPFNRRKPGNPHALKVDDGEFVGRQPEGSSERHLQQALADLFRRQHSLVARAYLARVKYAGSPEVHVALCLRADGAEQTKLAKDVGRVFASIFSADVHLDTLFVDTSREKALLDVCKPFYPHSPLSS